MHSTLSHALLVGLGLFPFPANTPGWGGVEFRAAHCIRIVLVAGRAPPHTWEGPHFPPGFLSPRAYLLLSFIRVVDVTTPPRHSLHHRTADHHCCRQRQRRLLGGWRLCPECHAGQPLGCGRGRRRGLHCRHQQQRPTLRQQHRGRDHCVQGAGLERPAGGGSGQVGRASTHVCMSTALVCCGREPLHGGHQCS